MSDFPTPSERKAADTSLGDLLGEVTRDVSDLMRQEVALAKAEIRQSATKAGKGAGLFGGAGYAGHLTVLFLSLAAWWGLGHVIDIAWAAVIVALVWAIVAAVLFVLGRREFTAVRGAPETVDSLKHLPDALKRNEENR
ncbi:phage holin family protein [Cryobacterium sp. PAMC25264]|uniref:phage holin family protein n=1 Tax=Cryobacterium sp. PAMC25264 TaxID=2861288 RepID=UPI001C6283F7|nr:phage holin family protein [Cryobacterium sp. PAMC25264]QYF73416.1 phage holin family protein [Cryobacterium sp. PAMC25264]